MNTLIVYGENGGCKGNSGETKVKMNTSVLLFYLYMSNLETCFML